MTAPATDSLSGIVVECRGCGASGAAESLEPEQVPYGENGEHFDVIVPVGRCPSCGFAWTDHRAEKLREEAAIVAGIAIRQHMEKES